MTLSKTEQAERTEARKALLKQIAEQAGTAHNASIVKDLAEAYALVVESDGPRSSGAVGVVRGR